MSNRPNEKGKSEPLRRSVRVANKASAIILCPVCVLPSNDYMVECDRCKNWHHHECVGLTESIARALPSWHCNPCQRILNAEQITEAINETSTMANSMYFNPMGASSTLLTNNRTVIRNPTFFDKTMTNDNPFEIESVQSRLDWADVQKESLQNEIEETIRKLQDTMKLVQDGTGKTRTGSTRSRNTIAFRPPNVTPTLDKSVSKPNDNISSSRMELLKEKERLIKMQIDVISEQLKQRDDVLALSERSHSNNKLPSPVEQLDCGLPQFRTDAQPVMQPNVFRQQEVQPKYQTRDLQEDFENSKPPSRSNRHTIQHATVTESDSVESDDHDIKISMSQWMARQSVQSLPIFDGNPQDWQMFQSAFDRTTKLCNFSNDENLDRLQHSLKGVARDLVQGQFYMPSCVPKIMKDLEQAFGRPDQMLHVYLQKIKNAPPPHGDKPESIMQFATAVKNLWAMMVSSNMKAHMDNPQMLQELVDKLPLSLKYQWASYILNMQYYSIETFTNWLEKLIKKTTLVMPTINLFAKNDKQKSSKPNYDKQDHRRQQASKERSHSQGIQTEVAKTCKVCSGTCKMVAECKKFLDSSHDDRWKLIREFGICKQCLKKHSFNRGYKCRGFVKCTVDNCVGRHHPLMHRDENPVAEVKETIPSYTQRFNDDRPMLRYIPVILSNGNVKVSDYAFLDEGSTGTMIEAGLAAELNLTGTSSTLYVEYTADCHHTEPSISIECLSISGVYEGAKQLKLKNMQTVKKLGLECQTLDYIEMAAQHNHLKYLPVQSYNNVRPRLLVGLNNWSCAVPSKVRYNGDGNPMAAKCMLGWSIFAGGSASNKNSVNYNVIDEINEFESLRDMVKKGLSIESLGVKPPPDDISSQEERRATQLLKVTTSKNGDRYQTGLLWKHPDVKLPDNSKMALRRMYSLEARLSRQPELAKAFQEQIADNIKLGYIRKLTASELSQKVERIWYLPLLAVQNPNKPGKIRIVYDAAATSNGVSLNSVLMKGPDPVTSLLGVLLRFRQHTIGIAGDITHMFSQVQIRQQDQHAQRFYWRDDSTKAPDTYVLQVMSFGATCSPASAMYVKNVNAEQFKETYPRAVQSIIQNHYVDDMLDGTNNEQDMIELVQEVKFIHSKAGFEIGKWKSNSVAVMKALGVSENCETGLNMNLDGDTNVEKVLGMWWNLETDSFTYSLRFNKGLSEILTGNSRPTKREMLRILMSIFDPLGLIAHYLAFLKVLIQDVWKSGSNWDEKIDDQQNKRWLKWLKMLEQIESIRVPRCYFSSATSSDNVEIQLHTMVDASIDCVAAVSYLRIKNGDHITVSLVGSKTKVAPIKPTSIPRLELTAALIGARLANSISELLTLEISRFTFWSDSKTVLSWLRSDTKNLKGQFVVFRIAEIQESTSVADWRYVPTRLNIADDATKWSGSPNISNSDRWFKGPPFLYENEQLWPEDKSLGHNTTEEMKQEIVMSHNVTKSLIQFERFSNWNRLLRAVAYAKRYCDIRSAKYKKEVLPSGYLSSEELKDAQSFIFKTIQLESFPSELKHLQQKSTMVDIKSKLYNLSPVLVDGVMRIKGRTGAIRNVEIPHLPEGQVSIETVQPIILPPDHYGTRLLIRKYHVQYLHLHHETVVNEIRQQYHVPKLRQILKKVVRSCARCKLLTAKPRPPQMANLPQERLTPYTRPFTFTGIDCMGPLEVVVGRRREKRWICLFTCLTVRAVHLEVLHHMDHDSFILAFRCFTQERGQPKKVFSDNGTNFVKAEQVLRDDLVSIDMKVIAENFEDPTMKWYFNPPSSPHMGGSWERLVKSVKHAFYAVPRHRPLNDQLLRSYMKEIQNIINSRPLTYLPLTSDESPALTPNHFLRGDSSGGHPIGQFNDDAKLLKWNWETSQLYAKHFWKRWVVEYLPELTRRSKWWGIVEPLKPGDVVLIVDANYTRNCWQRGRIESTNISKDGQVRSALVKTSTGYLTRPAAKLAKLDLDDCGLICKQTGQDTGWNMSENVQ